MRKLALVGLSTALGTTLGAAGVLAGQRFGFVPVPPTPGDPWETTPASVPAAEQAPQAGPVRYLSIGEVAELLGITNVELERDADLPEPDATVARTRGWHESTIERWLGERLARGGSGAES